MKAIEYTNAAREDLRNIFRYSVNTWGINQAKHYAEQLQAQVTKLADGSAFTTSLQINDRKLRKSYAGRHLIVFEQSEARILIVRILHEAMDIPRQLAP